jgi:hypothetical protein
VVEPPSHANRRNRVSDSLGARSQKLAGTYRHAIRALDQGPDDECERARVAVISHCMRELMLGLPTVLTSSSEARPRPSSDALLSRLPSLLAKHPEVDLGADQDVIPVPREVAERLDELVRTRTQEDGRNRRNSAVLIGGNDSSDDPVVKQWQKAYQFFLRWAHLDRDDGDDETLPSDEAIAGHMRVVEDLIEVRATAFFENLNSLQDLLNEINELVEDGE